MVVRMVLILVAAFACWHWIDWARVWNALASMSPLALGIAVALASADRVLMGFKWRQLVRAAGGSLRLRDATNIYYQTCFTDLVFPNVVASEGLRVYLGRRLGIPLALLLGSMAIERMVAAAVAIVLAAAGLLYLAAEVEPQMRLLFLEIIGATAVIAGFGVLAIWWTPLHRIAGRAVRERISPKLFQLLKKVSVSLVAYRAQPATLAINLVLAIAENLFQIVNFYVIGRGLGVRVPVLPFFAAIAVTALVRRLAMHVEGRGLGEGAAVVMFALLGVQKDAAVALTFAHYALWLLASLPGAYLLLRSGVRLSDLRASAAA
ncbi:MAG TPA: lysylphosphatidylglycerol synthase transmembrane domain-containing protein [Gemmatimonadaceae bacterium]